jgi:hypothetical protein
VACFVFAQLADHPPARAELGRQGYGFSRGQWSEQTSRARRTPNSRLVAGSLRGLAEPRPGGGPVERVEEWTCGRDVLTYHLAVFVLSLDGVRFSMF